MANKSKLVVVGIVGGVASGKTFVADRLAALGAAVVDADRLGHEVLREPAVRAAVLKRWGTALAAPDGQIDRRKLAAIVFGNSAKAREELAALEALIHPKMKKLVLEELERLAADGITKVAVLDAPVLLKSGWRGICDRIIYIEAPVDVRLARATARGWQKEDFERREAAQESLQAKRQAADLAIDNSGSAEATIAQIEQLWPMLASGSSAGEMNAQ